MMTNNAFQIVALLLIAASFYLLAVSLKDARVKVLTPVADSITMRLSLCGIFLSQLWYLLFPNNHDAYWLIFNSSVLLGLATFGVRYRKRYVSLDISFIDPHELVNIPTDKYVETSPGVWMRLHQEGAPAVVPTEKELIEIAERYPQSDNIFILFKVNAGALFPEHSHPKAEHTYLSHGEAQMIVGVPTVTPNRPLTVKPQQVHHFLAITYCQGISILEK